MSKPANVTVYRTVMLNRRYDYDRGNARTFLDWRWRFVVSNGQIVADSAEGYHRRGPCLRGVEIVLRVKPGSLQQLMPGDSKTIRGKYGDVTVKVEAS